MGQTLLNDLVDEHASSLLDGPAAVVLWEHSWRLRAGQGRRGGAWPKTMRSSTALTGAVEDLSSGNTCNRLTRCCSHAKLRRLTSVQPSEQSTVSTTMLVFKERDSEESGLVCISTTRRRTHHSIAVLIILMKCYCAGPIAALRAKQTSSTMQPTGKRIT